MKTFLRRLQRLEAVTAEIRSQGPSAVEVLRDRIRRRCVAEGKEPPVFSNKPRLRADGKPMTIVEILQARRRANAAEGART